MRFFGQQRQARAQTVRPLMLFALTLLVLAVAVNAALALTWRLVAWRQAQGERSIEQPRFNLLFGINKLQTIRWLVSQNCRQVLDTPNTPYAAPR
jgi:hypothetical protein